MTGLCRHIGLELRWYLTESLLGRMNGYMGAALYHFAAWKVALVDLAYWLVCEVPVHRSGVGFSAGDAPFLGTNLFKG
jgi:hypothetical protein